MASLDDYLVIVARVIDLEGGLSLDPQDRGNWTSGQVGVGKLLGTKFGVSAMSYPHLDIPNLTVADAVGIYERDYWFPSGASELPAPFAALVFDTAVNSGVGTAKRLLSDSGGSIGAFIALRYQNYASLDSFSLYGRGWVRRFASMVQFADSLADEPITVRNGLLLIFNRDNEEVLRLPILPGDSIIDRQRGDRRYIRVEPAE